MSNHALSRRNKDTVASYALWLGGFFGLCGLHRLYMGRTASGLLWLFTGGLCFIGQLVDVLFMPRMVADANEGRGW
jgi:TM2 domain-containing membrane protein YozV